MPRTQRRLSQTRQRSSYTGFDLKEGWTLQWSMSPVYQTFLPAARSPPHRIERQALERQQTFFFGAGGMCLLSPSMFGSAEISMETTVWELNFSRTRELYAHPRCLFCACACS